MKTLEVEDVLTWLDQVKDPEIPVLSIVDLGVISEVQINDNVKVVLTPTFVGCPAIEVMKEDIINVLKNHGIANPVVEVSFKKPWTSDLITEKGKAALKEFGLAPPPAIFTDLEILEHAVCPRCNGTNTTLKSPFGATLCRSIHYCNTCLESFEQFKPI